MAANRSVSPYLLLTLLPFHIAGIVLIMAGIWLTSRYGSRRPDLDEAAAVGTD